MPAGNQKPYPVLFIGEKPVDDFLVRVPRFVLEKCFLLRRARRKAN
jgi:hypothetical protein